MNNKLLITGSNSVICKRLIMALPKEVEVINNKDDLSKLDHINKEQILECDRIVLAHGVFSPNQKYKEMTEEDIVEILKINLLSTVKIIEIALENPNVRIAVVGSESGLKGSLNIAYGLSKTALHKYVEEKKILSPDQQLVCVAPSLIEDSRITLQRKIIEPVVVKTSLNSHPKKRGVFGMEIAMMIYYLLYVDQGYTTNTVIHINGGKYARS